MTRHMFVSTITTHPIKAPVPIRNQGQTSRGSVDLRNESNGTLSKFRLAYICSCSLRDHHVYLLQRHRVSMIACEFGPHGRPIKSSSTLLSNPNRTELASRH